jgi:Uma2 family endonuclease
VAEAAHARPSFTEYLAAERGRDLKHEYHDGTERAMSGGTIEHGRLAARLQRLVGRAISGRTCEVYSSDVLIRVTATNRALYPDVSVVCGRLEQDGDAIINPVVIVEVLSPSSEAYDRGEKFRHYRRVPSLREYVLVSQDQRLVEVWRREGEAWAPSEFGPGTVIRLTSIDADISIDELYENPLDAPS